MQSLYSELLGVRRNHLTSCMDRKSEEKMWFSSYAVVCLKEWWVDWTIREYQSVCYPTYSMYIGTLLSLVTWLFCKYMSCIGIRISYQVVLLNTFLDRHDKETKSASPSPLTPPNAIGDGICPDSYPLFRHQIFPPNNWKWPINKWKSKISQWFHKPFVLLSVSTINSMNLHHIEQHDTFPFLRDWSWFFCFDFHAPGTVPHHL